MSKTVIWVVVVILVAAGVWYVMGRSFATTSPVDTGTPSASSQTQSNTAGASDTSDAQLEADLNASDAQIQSANSAGASANSFNDTPVTQTE